jgi:O-methyltransferase
MNLEQKLYTDLLIKCITNSIYKDDRGLMTGATTLSDADRAGGFDWPSKAHSMVGIARLTNVRDLAQRAIDEGVPGDFIETGVWRGGCCILMRGVLAINKVKDRKVFVADSFKGLPKPNVEAFPKDAGLDWSMVHELAVSLEEVKSNFAAYDLLDDQVEFIKGYFSDTLSTVKADRFALLRLDGDLYESTIVALECLYPRLSPGGYVIIDDYGAVQACRDAADDYRARNNITSLIYQIDSTGVWWQTDSTFDEQAYLERYPDVALAVAKNHFSSGYSHYIACGFSEGRDVTRLGQRS